MVPASLAGTTSKDRTVWDAPAVIDAIQEWVATYGEPPRAADWNPSSAKWSGQTWRIERYRTGRADGTPWPSLNAAKRPFAGSLNAAVIAAGFEPARPGPRRRKDVDLEQVDRVQLSPDARAMVNAAIAQARETAKRVDELDGQLARVRARLSDALADRDQARRDARAAKAAARPVRAPAVKVVRERVVDDAAVVRAVARAQKAEANAELARLQVKEQVAAARMDAAEARSAAKRLASRLERAEATIGTLRDERRELKVAAEAAEDRTVALERTVEQARTQAAEQRAAPVVIREEAPEAAVVRAAELEAARAVRDALDAEVRAARAERELRETVAAFKGEARPLTKAELAELRTAGPAGPKLLAEALQALTTARRGGNPTRTAQALRQVAQAAVSWQERI